MHTMKQPIFGVWSQFNPKKPNSNQNSKWCGFLSATNNWNKSYNNGNN